MGSPQPLYHERLLHWIWEQQQFDFQQLYTACGKRIQLLNPGQHNQSDGPDFLGAEISIGHLRWYGDIEIHWRISDWNAHGHHQDPNFNNVILHIVFEETDHKSTREDGSTIPTLCLSSYLSDPLQSFLDQYQAQSKLPCAGQLSFISETAFEKQLEKAHQEYFEQKVDDLLEFYDPSLPPSKAWLKMFSIAFFDGLGISHNREPMRKLAANLTNKIHNISSREELRKQAIILSGINKRNRSSVDIRWKRKGCRPGNHPRPRIQQGVDALWYIYSLPFEQWMHKKPKQLWENLMNSISVTPSLGQERSSILFGTVFLPALYSLGNLLFSQQLKTQSWALWHSHRAKIPSSLLKIFNTTEIPTSFYKQKLGSIYQLRAYCRPRNCQDCKVFKCAISS
jgi:hypothetical protein